MLYWVCLYLFLTIWQFYQNFCLFTWFVLCAAFACVGTTYGIVRFFSLWTLDWAFLLCLWNFPVFTTVDAFVFCVYLWHLKGVGRCICGGSLVARAIAAKPSDAVAKMKLDKKADYVSTISSGRRHHFTMSIFLVKSHIHTMILNLLPKLFSSVDQYEVSGFDFEKHTFHQLHLIKAQRSYGFSKQDNRNRVHRR